MLCDFLQEEDFDTKWAEELPKMPKSVQDYLNENWKEHGKLWANWGRRMNHEGHGQLKMFLVLLFSYTSRAYNLYMISSFLTPSDYTSMCYFVNFRNK